MAGAVSRSPRRPSTLFEIATGRAVRVGAGDYGVGATAPAGRRSRLAPCLLWNRVTARPRKEMLVLHWALVFFVIALVAAALGFRGVAGLSAEFGWLFAVLAVILLVVGLLAGRRPPIP